MKEIYIYGAGGYGAEVADLVRSINALEQKWLLAGFIDDGKEAGTVVCGLEILGNLEELKVLASASGALNLVLAFGDPRVRQKIRQSLEGFNIIYPSLIHPNVVLGDNVRISEGNVINAFAVVSHSARLGPFCIVNFNAVVGHDAVINEFCSVMGGAQIGGEVQLGAGSYVGLNASILQGLSSGKNCLVAAGAIMNASIVDEMAVLSERSKTVRYNKELRKRNS